MAEDLYRPGMDMVDAADLIDAASDRGSDGPWSSATVRASLHPWVALMAPDLAEPLSTWLRESARRCGEAVAGWERGAKWRGPGDEDLPPRMSDAEIRGHVEHHWRHPLAFARMLLREGATP